MFNRNLMKYTKTAAAVMIVAGSVAITGCGDKQT